MDLFWVIVFYTQKLLPGKNFIEISQILLNLQINSVNKRIL